MTDEINTQGGPAFPVSIPGYGDNGWHGMTLRDWFAGQALATIISLTQGEHGCWDPVAVAAGAYAVADAMVEARQVCA